MRPKNIKNKIQNIKKTSDQGKLTANMYKL